MSAPYALKAGDAETLGGKPLSAFQLAAPQSSAGSAPQSAALPAGSAQHYAAPAEQANEITCASGTGCKTTFVPLFTSNGGSAKVSDSIITQSGRTVGIAGSESVSGNVSATGSVSGTGAEFSNGIASPVLNVSQTGTFGESGVAVRQPFALRTGKQADSLTVYARGQDAIVGVTSPCGK